MKVMVAGYCSVVCLSCVAFADDFKTVDGKEFKNVAVNRVEPDGIVLITTSGISKVYFTELPKEVQERFNYDATKAAAYVAQQAASEDAFRKQQEESSKKLTEERKKYWTEHSEGGSYWISGKIIGKSNNVLLIECSGEGHGDYTGAAGQIVLRNHPNFAMLAQGDRVDILAVQIASAQWGGEDHPYRHAYRVSRQ